MYQRNVEGNGGIIGGVLVGVGDRAIVVVPVGFELDAAGIGCEGGVVETFASMLSI